MSPDCTSIPAAFRDAQPLPDTRGFGSSMADTSFAMPALINASVHGGSSSMMAARLQREISGRAAAAPRSGARLSRRDARLHVHASRCQLPGRRAPARSPRED